jgi:hypothetical protein
MGGLRKALFSRSLRLLPLPHQIGIVEGLIVIVQTLRGVLSLSDQHLLAFVSELLKMSSVADGEMSDPTLKDLVVDKNGYALSADSTASASSHTFPTHASSVFHRRLCIIDVEGAYVVVPEQYPVGIQLRVSTIVLFHSLIRAYSDPFFDAEQSSPIGKSRGCHSLRFRYTTDTSELALFPRKYSTTCDKPPFSHPRINSSKSGVCRPHCAKGRSHSEHRHQQRGIEFDTETKQPSTEGIAPGLHTTSTLEPSRLHSSFDSSAERLAASFGAFELLVQ